MIVITSVINIESVSGDYLKCYEHGKKHNLVATTKRGKIWPGYTHKMIILWWARLVKLIPSDKKDTGTKYGDIISDVSSIFAENYLVKTVFE